MKKRMISTLIVFSMVAITNAFPADYKKDVMEKIIPSAGDIPAGFEYGKVPEWAKKTIKNNPWFMDKGAIRRLAREIYPGGDFNKISEIHSSIIAKKGKTYGDDMVCYIILFSNSKAARDELKKITEFYGYNKDRVILITKNNIAVFLHVDDVKNFELLKDFARKIEEKLKDI
jgi:hypothetical protein